MIRKNKHGRQGAGLYPYISIWKKIKIFLSENTGPISILLGRKVSLVSHYQDCSKGFDSSKIMAARGEAYFPYVSIKKTLKLFMSEINGPISI